MRLTEQETTIQDQNSQLTDYEIQLTNLKYQAHSQIDDLIERK